MALDPATAHSVKGLYAGLSPDEREHLAVLALTLLAELGARDTWDHLDDLAEMIAQQAQDTLGVAVSGPGAEQAQPHWERIAPWS